MSRKIKSCIFVDIDHTLSDAFYRDRLIKSHMDENDWEVYHSLNSTDQSYPFMEKMINAFIDTANIYMLTSRPESNRRQTERWLRHQGIYYDDIYMRPNGNREHAWKLKPKMLKNVVNGDYSKIICVFEDDEKVCNEYVKSGIKTLQCRFGEKTSKTELQQQLEF